MIPKPTNQNNGAGSKAYGAVLLVLIAGVYVWVGDQGREASEKLANMETRMTRMVQADLDHQQKTDTKIGEIGVQFTEVETQIRGGKNVVNLKFQEMERLVAILWEKVMGSRFPDTDYWPHVNGGEG